MAVGKLVPENPHFTTLNQKNQILCRCRKLQLRVSTLFWAEKGAWV
jgi:hypothetical protein